MKYSLIFLMSICFNMSVFSQTVVYTYDNSGNRITRKISVSKSLLNETDSSKIVNEDITELIEDKSIKVYPNPVIEEINVEISGYDENLKGSIALFDQGGRMLIINNQISSRNSINLSRYPTGIYFIIIKIGTSRTNYTIVKN